MMNERIMYYYFARHVPSNNKVTEKRPGIFYLTAIKWECIFTVKDDICLANNALYTHHEDKSQIFLHHVTAEDYDLPDAFGVASMSRIQFDEQYSPTRPQLVKHPNGGNLRLPAKPWEST